MRNYCFIQLIEFNICAGLLNLILLPAKWSYVIVFFDATLVYQGYARGLDLHMIRQLHELACKNIEPDLTLLLDLSPEEGLARAWRRIEDSRSGKDDSRFEQEDLNFHRKVRDGYLALARQNPHRFRIINAAQDETGVARDISAVLDAFLVAADS